MIKKLFMLILCFGFLPTFTADIQSQETNYEIHVRKDFGYNMGSTIQGRFTISLLGDEANIASVTFYIDDSVLQRVDTAPFIFQFQTDQFDPGTHQLFAEVVFRDGMTQRTSTAQYNFLSQEDANRQVRTILIAIGGAIVGTLLLVAVIQSVIINQGTKPRHQSGTSRSYGVLGGTICPKCGYPFRRHIWGINLLIGRLDRCDNCGKWVMTVRATPTALRMAEKSESEKLEKEEPAFEDKKSEEDRLDETKYFDKL